MDTDTQEQPIDKRRKEAHPEIIVAGGITYERNDIAAKKYGESERSANRRDPDGAPRQYFGGVKYRPQLHYDNYVASTIQQGRPRAPRRGLRR